jgi:enterochelin esterase-like enzyme
MRSNPRLRGQYARLVLSALALMLVPGATASAQTALRGAIVQVKVTSAALKGNLAGESAEREVHIYLPPGYDNGNQRYPVVYLLHGYSLTAQRWIEFTNLAAKADRAIAAGARPMILVNPDAYTTHGGSMYSSSPTIGDWETFIAEDLVAYVDKNYRTLAQRDSRGLGGHSMGGYGTLRIGMKRPDVFAALYPMSSCCVIDANLTAGAAGGRGAAPAGRAGAPGTAPAPGTAAPAAAPAPVPGSAAAAAPSQTPPQAGRGGRGRGAGAPGDGRGAGRGGFGNVGFGLAAAWAPNPKNPPNYFDLPVVDGQPQPLVIAKFAANSPFAMLPQYVTNLKKYKAIMLDIGEQDGLIGQNRQFVEWMQAFGVPHTFDTYEGDHTNKVAERLETKVLPFFAQHLSFTAPRR